MSRPLSLARLLAEPGLLALLGQLRQAATGPQPERALVRQLAELTGGGAEIRASWGEVVAAAGVQEGEGQPFPLAHGRRQVGRLTLWAPPEWTALGPLAAEYALLSRLQSAAAGAARRRVGERTLDALLSGQGDPAALGDEAYVVAVAALAQDFGSGASARAAQAHALDVLAGAGEGYLVGSGRRGLCTVQGDGTAGDRATGERALWLWPAADVQREAAELYAALTESTGQPVRLRVGRSTHRPEDAARALAEAPAYFATGPVHATPTKPGRVAAGLGYVRHIAALRPTLPWYAIGGIDLGNVQAVLDAGATRIAVVRAVLDADDCAAAAHALREALMVNG
ncbi:thiamine phosphate synthase [Deinococcus radiodurans]|uniref:thiamine phosphate synthase n=1 Tax=Deinococcus radiodurans TaxID=1299 RepID=UPI001D08EDF0|nr:thiamine phosphate synthase [Deinococcus radiodurans]